MAGEELEVQQFNKSAENKKNVMDSDASATTYNQNKSLKSAVVFDKIFRTVCLYACFGVLGLVSSLLGNTAVHLERLFNVDTATMSLAFTLHMTGYLTGSVACGLIYDRVDHELAFAASNLMEGLATMAAPLIGRAFGLPAFIATMFFQSISQGFVDSGGQSYCVALWVGHRYREPVLQGAHAMWSLGGMIGPFITARFLVDLPHIGNGGVSSSEALGCTNGTAGNSSDCTHYNLDDYTTISNEVLTSTWNLTTMVPTNGSSNIAADVARVRFAYIANGSLILFAGLLFIIAYIRCRYHRARSAAINLNGQASGVTMTKISADDIAVDQSSANPLKGSPTSADNPDSGGVTHQLLRDKCTYLLFCTLIFLFYHVYLYVELVPIQFMTTFTVKYLGFPINNASLLMSLFYGFHFGGRVLGIPLSTFLRPRTMVIIDLIITAAAYLLLLAFVRVWPAVIWPSAAMAGMAMATTFPTGVLWISEAIPVTGRVAAIMVIGYSVGGMIGPMIVGTLFESSTPMWFVYVVVAASVTHVILFFNMMLFVRRCSGSLLRATTSGRLEDDEIIVTAATIEGQVPRLDSHVFQSSDTTLNGSAGRPVAESDSRRGTALPVDN